MRTTSAASPASPASSEPAVKPAVQLVDQILDLTSARPASLGRGRLICIDGPAGSGKTTLAAALAARTGAPVVHLDDLYPGWDGLDAVVPEVLALLEPLAHDRAGSFRRYDWAVGSYAERVPVEPAAVVVLEGVNAGNRAWADRCTTLLWVETDAATRLRRGLARDGEAVRPEWEKWMRDESVVFAREGTRERADLEVRT